MWRIRTHLVRMVSALIGGFLDRRAGIHCQLPETQRYKRYRNLPYPHLAPKTPKNSRDKLRTNTKVRPKVPTRVTSRAGKQATNSETETTRNNRTSRHRQEKIKSWKKERNGNTSNTGKTRAGQTTKVFLFVAFVFHLVPLSY